MARPKLPTKVKALKGTLEKKRLLANEYEPEILESATPPDYFTQSQVEIFNKVSSWFIKDGLLSEVDLPSLVVYCIEYDRYITINKELKKEGLIVTSKNGAEYPNPKLKVATEAWNKVFKISLEFGMSPAARSKVAVAPKEKKTLKGMLNHGFGS